MPITLDESNSPTASLQIYNNLKSSLVDKRKCLIALSYKERKLIERLLTLHMEQRAKKRSAKHDKAFVDQNKARESKIYVRKKFTTNDPQQMTTEALIAHCRKNPDNFEHWNELAKRRKRLPVEQSRDALRS